MLQIDQVALSNANDWKFKFVDLLKYDMVNDAQDTTNPNIYFTREMDTDGNWVTNEATATFGTPDQLELTIKLLKMLLVHMIKKLVMKKFSIETLKLQRSGLAVSLVKLKYSYIRMV